MKLFLKTFFSVLIIFITLFFTYIIKPVHPDVDEHFFYPFELRLYILKLKIIYNQDLYDWIDTRTGLQDPCNGGCYTFIDQFYKIGIEHNPTKDISDNLMHLMIEERHWLPKNANLNKQEELLLSLKTKTNPSLVNSFLCDYKTPNYMFIKNLKQKYNIKELHCEKLNFLSIR